MVKQSLIEEKKKIVSQCKNVQDIHNLFFVESYQVPMEVKMETKSLHAMYVCLYMSMDTFYVYVPLYDHGCTCVCVLMCMSTYTCMSCAHICAGMHLCMSHYKG